MYATDFPWMILGGKCVKIVEGGVNAPKGFLATGRHIGIKKVKKDISLLYSQTDAVAAGVFTQNTVKAAPVIRNEALIRQKQTIRGIVTVSGVANACTGQQGLEDNAAMAREYAKALGVEEREILTAATGVIGVLLPMEVILSGIRDTAPYLSSSAEEAKNAGFGIFTTDTFLKEIAVELTIAGSKVRIGAMAKGSGMVHPNMATVLAFITTDIVISQELLQKALQKAVADTYNMISVDGCVSTNDMALILANGQANNPPFEEESIFFEQFCEALLFINRKLAMDVVHDGEGAGKFMEIQVEGARDVSAARRLAKAVATDNLVKTALYGEDANWGRVLAAMGGCQAPFSPDGVELYFQSEKGTVKLMELGRPIWFDENQAADILKERDIVIKILLRDGTGSATAWGCDLGHEYVRINGEYRSRT